MPLLFTDTHSSAYLSTKEASEISGYNPDYLSRLCRSGAIKSKQLGRTWIIDRAALEAFVESQKERKEQLRTNIAEEREREYREHALEQESAVNAIRKVEPVAYNRQLAALAVSLVVVAGTAYGSTSPLIVGSLNRAPQAAERLARTFGPQVVLPESDFRVAQSVTQQPTVAVRLPTPQEAAASIARLNSDMSGASSALASVAAFDSNRAAPAISYSVTGQARAATVAHAFTHPREMIASLAYAGVRGYVGIGWNTIDAAHATNDAYLATIFGIGSDSLDAALVVRDTSVRAQRVPDAILAKYERGLESYAVAAPRAADTAVFGTLALGSVLADAGLATPDVIATGVRESAQDVSSVGIALLDRAAGTQVAIAPATEQDTDSFQAVVLGFMGNVASRIDGPDGGVPAETQVAGAAFAPGSWQYGIASMISKAVDAVATAIGTGVRAVASVFGLPSFTTDLAILPFSDGEVLAPPSPVDVSSPGFSAAILGDSIAQTIIQQYYPQTIVTGPTDQYILDLVRPYISRNIDSTSDRVRTKAERRDGTLENTTIEGGTATLESATIDSLVVGSTTVNQLTLGTAIITSATSTNLFSQEAIFTNATTTNSFISSLRATSGVIDALTSTLATITTAAITTLTATDATFTNATTTNATTTNAYTQNAVTDNATTTNAFITSLRATTGIIDTLTSTLATLTTAVVTTLTATDATFTNATTTNATTTNAYTQNAVTDNATTTNSFIASLRATTGVIDTLTSTLATLTDAIVTNLTVTNAVITNSTTTNATTTNAYIERLSVGTTSSTGLIVSGNAVLGGSSADSIIVNASFNSNLIPSTNATFDLGSPSYFWDDGYFDTITVNNISAASTSIGGTASETFTLNSDNATSDTEDISLLFYRGMVVPNALLTWNSTADRFEFNQPLYIENMSGSTTIPTLVAKGIVGQSADLLRALDSSDNPVLVANANGRVGIGTSSPLSTLFMDTTDALRLPTGTTAQRPTGYTGYVRYNTTTLQFEGYGADGVWQGLGGVVDTDQDTYISADTNNIDEDTLRFFTGGSERMTISSAGNVGIGTTTPNNLLTVAATGGGSGINVTNSSGVLMAQLIQNTAGNGGRLVLAESGTSNLVFTVNSDSGTSYIRNTRLHIGSNSAVSSRLGVSGNVAIGSTYSTLSAPTNGLLVEGNVGIGSSTPYAKLSVTGAGTTTGVNFQTTNSSNAPLFTILDSGNVGIGSTTPVALLSLKGTDTTSKSFILTDSSDVEKFSVTNAAILTLTRTNSLTLNPFNGSGGNDASIIGTSNIRIGSSVSSPSLFVGSGAFGNVGIGTTSPRGKLEIYGSAAAEAYLNAGTNASLRVEAGGTAYSADLGLFQNQGGYRTYGNYLQTTVTDSDLAFVSRTNNSDTTRLTIKNATGNVGIGTTSPANNLHVYSTSNAGGITVDGTTNPALNLRTNNTTRAFLGAVTSVNAYAVGAVANDIVLQLTGGGSFHMGFGGVNQTWFTVKNSGNVGIGSTTPYAKLSVKGEGTTTGVNFQTTNSSDSPLFTILDSGSVGIGSSTPSATLAVAGNARFLSGGRTITLDGDKLNWETISNLSIGSQSTAGGNVILDYPTAGSLLIREAGGSSFAVFDASNNFGLGTTSPSAKLAITGSGTGTGRAFAIANSSNIEKFTVFDNGNVSFGGSNSAIEFDVRLGSSIPSGGIAETVFIGDSTTAGTAIGYSAGNYGWIQTTGSIPLYINSIGNNTILNSGGSNVGIGTTSPSSKLDVAGFINTSEFSGYRQGGRLLAYASTTNGSTIFGLHAGGQNATTSASLTQTIAIGYESLKALTTGFGNTAVGYQTLSKITTAGGNTAVGSEALENTSTGTNNTALGLWALNGNTTGYSNTAVGYLANWANQTGYRNVSIGENSMEASTSGYENVVIGYSALFRSTAPNNTVAIGNSALRFNTTGATSVAIGTNAGSGTGNYTGVGSVVVGYQAGENFGTGSDYNTLIGYQAGRTITTGARNIMIGNGAVAPSITGSDQLNIGNTLYGNLSTGAIGIGSTTPYAKLSIKGVGSTTGVNFQTTNSSNSPLVTMLDNGGVGIGTTTPSTLLTIHSNSAALQSQILLFNHSNGDGRGSAITFANESPGNIAQIGASRGATNSNARLQFFTGSFGTLVERMRIEDGNVGIGTTSPFAKLSVAGNIYADGTITGSTITATTSISAPYFTATSATATSTFAGGLYIANGAYNSPSLSLASSPETGFRGSANILILDLADSGSGGHVQFRSGSGTADGLQGGGSFTAALDFISAASLTNPTVFPSNGDLDTGIGGDSADGLSLITGGASRLFINSSGNVGIGTTSPAQELSIAGDIELTGDIYDAVTGEILDIQTNDFVVNGKHIQSGFGVGVRNNRGTVYGMDYRSAGSVAGLALNSNSIEALSIDTGGNIGIGSTTPTAKFGITGSGATTGRAFTVANSSNVDKFTVLDNGTVQVTNTVTNTGGDLTLNGTGNVDISSFGGVSFRVRNTGSAVLAGGLGITSSFTGGADVKSILNVVPTFTGTQTALTYGLKYIPAVSSFTNSSTFYGAYVDVSAVNTGTVYSGIFTGGNVGIGTTSPLAALSVSTSGSNAFIVKGTSSAGNPRIISENDAGIQSTFFTQRSGAGTATVFERSDAGTVMLFDSSGRIGMGTGTPAAKLQVLSTTEQLRLSYDASNYLSTTIGSTGGVTFNANGSGAGFTFSDAITDVPKISITGTSAVTALSVSNAFNSTALAITSSGTAGSPLVIADSNFLPAISVTKTTTASVSNNNSDGLYILGTYQHTGSAGLGKGVNVTVTNNTGSTGILYGGTFSATANTAGATAVGLSVTAASSGGTAYAALFNGGNVGIGTTTPATNMALVIDAGSNNPLYLNRSGGDPSITFAESNSTVGQVRADAGLGNIGFASSGGSLLFNVNTTSGSVGIGTTTPSARFAITASGTGTGRAFAFADSSNAEKITIFDNGSIAIATTSPAITSKIAISGLEYSHGAVAPLYIKSRTKYDLGAGNGLGISALFEGTSGSANPGLGFRMGGASGGIDLSGSGDIGFYATSTAYAPTYEDVRMMILGASGKVGIGTTTPWGLLSVNPSGITGPSFAIGSSTATQFVVTNAGNVGIGTASPGNKLTVVVTSSQDGINVTSAGANQPVIRVSDTTNSRAGLMRLAGGSSGIFQVGGGSAGTTLDSINLGTDVVGSAANAYLDISTTRFNFLNGNVGIGTSTPTAKLAITGTGTGTGRAFTVTDSSNVDKFTVLDNGNLVATGAGLYGSASTFTIASTFGGGTNGAININSANTAIGYNGVNWLSGGISLNTTVTTVNDDRHILLTPKGTGNVGVGSTTPYAKLSVTGAGTSTGVNFQTTNSSNSPLFTILDSGRVGIGTVSPGYTLDVAGFINSDQYSGYKQAGNTILYASSTNLATLVGNGAGGAFATSLTTARGVTAIGYQAYNAVATAGTGNWGLGNTAVGYQSLGNATSSPYNTAVGYQAGQNVQWSAASSALDHSGNTAIGYLALKGGVSTTFAAAANTAVGAGALTSIQTGSGNVGIGVSALGSLTTGVRNVGIGGTFALSSLTTGSGNVGIGGSAMSALTTGVDNVVIGYNTMSTNKTGSNNVAIGPAGTGNGALLNNTSATNTVAIGSGAGWGSGGAYTNEGGVYLGYFAGSALLTGSDYNTLIGTRAGYDITTGANNIIIGADTSPSAANGNLTTGSNNIQIGHNLALPSATASGQLNIQNIIFGTGNTGTASTLSTGNIGIGTTTPFGKFSITGPSSGNSLVIANSSNSPKVLITTAGLVHITDNYSTGFTPTSLLSVNSGSHNTLVMTTTGRIGISTGSDLGGILNVENNGTVSRPVGIFEGASGQTGSFIQVRSNAATAGDIFTIESTGFVGIGTTTPNVKLDIRGSSASAASTAGIFSINTTSTFQGLRMGISDSSHAWIQSFNNLPLSLNPLGNNVGIGTTTPLAKLSVKGAGTTTGANFQTTDSSDSPLFTILDSGNVGIGTTTPQASLDIRKSYSAGTDAFRISFSDPTQYYLGIQPYVVGSGNVGYKFRTNNNTTAVDALSITGTGNVGIGTTTPATKLHISGGTNVSGTDSTTGTVIVGDSSSLNIGIDANEIQARSASNASTLYLNFKGGDVTMGNAGQLNLIASSGNVGIGTTTPFGKLSVKGTGTTTGVNFQTTNSSDSPLFTILDNGNVGIGTTTNPLAKLQIVSGNSTALLMTLDGLNQYRTSLDTTFSNSFAGNNTLSIKVSDASTTGQETVATFTGQGYVGIGTSTPTTKLDVYHPARYSTFTGTDNGPINIQGGDGSNGYFTMLTFSSAQSGANQKLAKIGALKTASGSYLYLGTSNNYTSGITNSAMVIDPSGNVGVGTTSPWAQLSVNPSGITGPSFAIGSSTATQLVVTNAGNVGIGTAAPSSQLHVYKDGDTGIVVSAVGLGKTSSISLGGTNYQWDIKRVETDGNLRFHYNQGAADVMTLTRSSTVGIGTTTPGDGSTLSSGTPKLHVVGSGGTYSIVQDTSSYAGIASIGATEGNLSLIDTGATSGSRVWNLNSNDGSLSFRRLSDNSSSLTSTPLIITSTGAVGVGTTTPGGMFSIHGAGNELQLSRSGVNNMYGLFISGSGATSSVNLGEWGTGAGLSISQSGNVGMGTTEPSEKLQVVGDILLGEGGVDPDNRGYNILQSYMSLGETEGGASTILGNNVKVANGVGSTLEVHSSGADGSGWLKINYSTGFSYNRVGANTIGTQVVDTTGELFNISTAGSVRFNAYGAGTLTTDASGNITASSDERLKEVNGEFTRGLDAIAQLSPILYNWNATSGLDQRVQYAGFSAQNVQRAIPEAVDTDPRGYLTLQDRPILAASINAIKELAGRTDTLSIATSTLAARITDIETSWMTSQEAAALPKALTATQVTAESLEITESITTNGIVSAARFVVPSEAQTFTLGNDTITVTAPSEALIAGSVDLYTLATYALANVEQLATRTELLAVKIEDLSARVTALESGMASTTLETIDGAAGLSASTLKNLLRMLGMTLSNGIASVKALVTEQLVFTADENGTSSAGSIVINSGETEVEVENAMVLPTSKIFITFTGSVQGSWYLTEKQTGSFKVKFSQPQPSTTGFDYFIVQTEGQIASAAASAPEPTAPTSSEPAPTAPAPVSQEGGPTVTLIGVAAIQIAQGAVWTDPGATATAADGTSLTVAVSGSVDANTPGIYNLTYRATDSQGLIGEVSRIVSVLAPSVDGGAEAPAEEPPTVTEEPASEPTAIAEPAPEPTPEPDPAPAPAPEAAAAPAPAPSPAT